MVYAQPRILPRKGDAQSSLRFQDTNRSSTSTTRPNKKKKKKRKRKETAELWTLSLRLIPGKTEGKPKER